jgi:hypothetical protein
MVWKGHLLNIFLMPLLFWQAADHMIDLCS